MSLQRTPSGIGGLDEILEGGYPAHAVSLLKGGPGTGKTLFTLSLVASQLKLDQHVILITCEEAPEKLLSYMESSGFAANSAYESGQLSILDFRPDDEIPEITGEYDLGALFLRIDHALKQSGAEVLCIDSLQYLLHSLDTQDHSRELFRLFSWLRKQNITTLITSSENIDLVTLERFEEYNSDCVIHLTQNVENHLMTRYLRVIKLRGSGFASNNYPFSLTSAGVRLMPITSTRLSKKTSSEAYLSSGNKELDALLGGKGLARETTMIFSGQSGTGKTLFACLFARSAASQGLKTHYITFEETADRLVSNAMSAGIDLSAMVDSKHLSITSTRAIESGLEEHLIALTDWIDRENPDLVIIDPISALTDLGSPLQLKLLLIRFLSYIQSRGTTVILNELIAGDTDEHSHLLISSLCDTWIRLRSVESNGEQNRMIHVVKSRGSANSNQVREYIINGSDIQLEHPYIGDGKIEFGTAKLLQMERDRTNRLLQQQKIDHLRQSLRRIESLRQPNRKVLDALLAWQYDRLKIQLLEIEHQFDTQIFNRDIVEHSRS